MAENELHAPIEIVRGVSSCPSDTVMTGQKMNAHMQIPEDNMKKCRRLEEPVFYLLFCQLNEELGNPTKLEFEGDPWLAVWEGSHLYRLEYTRRPQTADMDDRSLPDFILEVDGKKRLAIECKNHRPTSEWTTFTAKRDIESRFKWLPANCKRVLLASHLQAKGAKETAEIHKRLRRAGIQIHELGHFFAHERWEEVEAELGPMATEWLDFVRRGRRKTPKRRPTAS